MKFRPLSLALLLCALPAAAPAAAVFTETFSNPGNAEGWQGGLSLTVSQDASRLVFSAADGYLFDSVLADATASNAAFTGNFSDAGIASVSFDLLINPGSDLARAALTLTDSAGNQWDYPLVLTLGTVQSFTVPVVTSAGWTQIAGSDSFAVLLSEITGISLSFEEPIANGNPAGLSGTLDNFATAAVPEPGAALLTLPALLLPARRRRDRPANL